ncbi:nucleotidyl transferase AbiEii/AbiGii toxin family protein [Massilia sp. YIM B02443]|uniref:nucleotidyl transferase AbiEii/AbiGii toxin family protein n=1 Tax=Massilia sp. YIM B02443 TaxID=3050127 RepID=UPI0025B692C3|nr:nucleotidyl transferase AbiEii/AbiGii toxin family protein [Massilia sp. YIM B02443]MDN4040098.1 nucleotidyl transferase AbiEii/AbiGii toxin family protein [Massilia sp. YIM B02443]
MPRSIRTDHPIDPVTVNILRAVAEEAHTQKIDYMLVGATARDVLLTHIFGLATRRATYDVDFAVAVKDWDQFAALREGLMARKTFKAGGEAQQRLYYQEQAGDLEYHLDLVPFGGVSQGTNTVAWPPDMKIIMNVAGYDDVLAAAERVTFAPDFEGNVVSLPGLAILKLVAWSDRGRANPRDAQDLIHLMDNYAAAGNIDRVYDEEGVIDAGDYDPDLAGVYLLGKDIRRVTSADTLDVLNQIIERDFDRLAHEMTRTMRHLEDAEKRVDKRLRLLQQALA